jgi:hypothetical protein
MMIMSCADNQGEDKKMADTFEIRLGMQGDEFSEANHLGGRTKIDRQPAGLNFHEHDWPSNDRGRVTVKNGSASFLIPDVLSVMGTEDADKKEKGIYHYSVNFGMAGGGDVEHDAVRKEFTDFLKSIESAGWRRVISYTDPRLSGEAAYQYYLDKPLYSFPLDYELSLEQWMNLDRITTWRWQANGQYMTLSFHRDRKRMDPDKPGGYLFVIQIMGFEEYAKAFFDGDDRERWRDLWIETITPLKRTRLEREKMLEKAGVPIDKDYRDPIVHPDDPVDVDEP